MPAEPPPAQLRQQAPESRKIVFLGGPARRGRCAQPAGQPPGGVRAASPASPGGPRPPTGRRASADWSAGFRERVPAPARPLRPRRPEGAPPAPPAPRLRGSPTHTRRPRSRARAGRPLRASVRPASAPRARRPPQRTGKGREPAAPRPAAPSGAAPRELVQSPAPAAAHRPPPSPPACARERPLAPSPHLRRAPAPNAPPGPAVYTGSDVSGPAPPPPQADAGVAADPGALSQPPLREPGGGGPELPTSGAEDLPVGLR